MPVRIIVVLATLAIAIIYLIKASLEKRRCEVGLAAAHLVLAAVVVAGGHDGG